MGHQYKMGHWWCDHLRPLQLLLLLTSVTYRTKNSHIIVVISHIFFFFLFFFLQDNIYLEFISNAPKSLEKPLRLKFQCVSLLSDFKSLSLFHYHCPFLLHHYYLFIGISSYLFLLFYELILSICIILASKINYVFYVGDFVFLLPLRWPASNPVYRYLSRCWTRITMMKRVISRPYQPITYCLLM